MKILQTFIFLIAIFGYSQPPKNYYDYNSQYSQDRREGQKNLEKQADLNRQPNASYKSTSTGSTFSPSYNDTPKTLTPEEEAEIKKQKLWREKYDAEQEVARKIRSDESAKDRKDEEPFIKLLLQKGITQQDSKQLAEKLIWQKKDKYGKYGKEGRDFYTDAVETGNYIAYFYQNIDKADFDSLKLCIDKTTEFGATITANTMSNLLITRYPTREADLESTQIEKFKKFFNNLEIMYSNDQYYTSNNKKVVDDYFAFEAKNPKVNLIILNSIKDILPHDAYDMISEYYHGREDCPKCFTGKEKRMDRANFEKLMLQEIQVKAKNGIANCKINPYQMLLDEKKSNSDLIRERYYDNNNGHTFIGYGSKKNREFGVVNFVDGRVYYGSFKRGNKKNIFIFKNRAVFEGNSIFTYNPTQDGVGKVTFPNGYYVAATFKNFVAENASYFNESGNSITKEEFEKYCDISSLNK